MANSQIIFSGHFGSCYGGNMNRSDFRKNFKSAGPVVLPVIHALDRVQAEKAAGIVVDGNWADDACIDE
jgi:hypothetical protein